jgi:hypothetical protein
VDLHNIKTDAFPSASISQATISTTTSAVEFASDKIFQEMKSKLNDNAELAKSINSVYAFKIAKGDALRIYGNFFRFQLFCYSRFNQFDF